MRRFPPRGLSQKALQLPLDGIQASPPRQEPETPVTSPAQSHRHFTEPTAAAKKNARSSPLIVRACPVTVNPAPARISPELTRQSPWWRLPGGMRSPLASTRASYAVLVAGAQLLLRP